jgi:hypothetical protein
LKAPLLLQDANQASSSTIPPFFALDLDLSRKREHQTREEGSLSNTEDTYALCKKGKPGWIVSIQAVKAGSQGVSAGKR